MADDVIQNGRYLGPYLSFYQKLKFYYLNFEKKNKFMSYYSSFFAPFYAFCIKIHAEA